MRYNKITLVAGLAAVPFVFLMIAFFPFFYNEHIASLGRFSKSISEGQNEIAAVEAMLSFEKKYSDSSKLYDGISSVDLYGDKIEESRVVSLVQDNLFDDIQLRVMFKDEKVYQVVVISD